MNQENNFDGQVNNGIPNSQPLQNNTDIQTTNVNETQLNNKSPKKSNIGLIIGIIIGIALIVGFTIFAITSNKNNSNNEINSETKKSAYWISGNSLEAFDLYFLQLENGKQNKVYSPLSIKYALGMLEEGTNGESKTQISNIIGNYEAKNYANSKNMSFANAMFIKDTYKNSVKENYTNSLISKYNAEVKTDSFATPNTVNSWISDKTLGLINNLFSDISQEEFLLINALAIDMEWQEKFLKEGKYGGYAHEKSDKEGIYLGSGYVDYLVQGNFDNMSEYISGMKIGASINNYDIINEIGEESIRKTVGDAYRDHIKNNLTAFRQYKNLDENFEITDEYIEEEIKNYLDNYIQEIEKNYHNNFRVTDFSVYTDENVKVFAKDLKEYDGTTLQYVGIMPIKEDLTEYVKNIKSTELNNIISKLKELKSEDFEEGKFIKIEGYIPKFKFEYELNLTEDLNKLGIVDVFNNEKADLSNLTTKKGSYISDTKHKANIEFTQDGIKAAAVTTIGGRGAGGYFDYFYEVPTEFIDLTFDKPYMFLIRDKQTGEIWFVGTVYNPLLYSEDTTKGY